MKGLIIFIPLLLAASYEGNTNIKVIFEDLNSSFLFKYNGDKSFSWTTNSITIYNDVGTYCQPYQEIENYTIYIQMNHNLMILDLIIHEWREAYDILNKTRCFKPIPTVTYNISHNQYWEILEKAPGGSYPKQEGVYVTGNMYFNQGAYYMNIQKKPAFNFINTTYVNIHNSTFIGNGTNSFLMMNSLLGGIITHNVFIGQK